MTGHRMSLLAPVMVAAGCGTPDYDAVASVDREPPPACSDLPALASPEFVLDTVATGLEVPWDMAFTRDGRILVTERPGRIRVIEGGVLRTEPWAELEVEAVGEAGLMGIAVAPDFENTGHVYVVGTVSRSRISGALARLHWRMSAFLAPSRLSPYVNRIWRLTDRGGRGEDPEVVVEDIPANQFHAGSALAVGPDGLLYVTSGEGLVPTRSADPHSLGGKVLRYELDGTVPGGNPLPDSPVYASGVRNPQGMDWDTGSGQLFLAEHGPSGMPAEKLRRGLDEVNVARAGGDYGWPRLAGWGDHPGSDLPIHVWTDAVAPAGLAVYDGPIGEWYGDLFVGTLRGQGLRRLVRQLEENDMPGVRCEEPLFHRRLGRIRSVAMGPDGGLYFSTSNRDGRGRPGPLDDLILRVSQQP